MAKRFPIFKDESGVGESSTVAVFDETTTPANAANQAKIYSKDVAGVSKMHALDSDGTEIELGTGGGGSSLVTAPGPQHSDTTSLSPVAQYTLNNTLADSSGNGNDLTESSGSVEYNGICHVPGDASAYFSTDTLEISAVDPALVTTGAVTGMVWINPNSVVTDQYLFTCANTSSSLEAENTVWSLRIFNSGLKCFHEYGISTNEEVVSGSSTLLAGSTQHIAFTRAADGVSFTFYHNGVQIGTATAANAPTGGGSSKLYVGSSQVGTISYSGYMWDLMIFTEELTAEQIKAEYQRQVGQSPVVRFGRALHGLDHSPLGLYQLQGDGTDASGNGRDLTANGSSVYSAGWAGTAAYIENTNAQTFSRSDASFAVTGALSVYGLIKADSITGDFRTIAGYSTNGGTSADNTLWQMYLDTSSTSLVYFHQNGTVNNNIFDSSVPIPLHEWVWIGFTRDSAGTGIKLFVNGELIGSSTLGNAPDGGGNSNLEIGRQDASDNMFDGLIQSVKIVSSELTEAEMKAEYERCFGVGDGTGIAHQDKHLLDGSDELDGDQIGISWNPTNYTPIVTPSEVTSVDHLTAHLAGIDTSLGGDSDSRALHDLTHSPTALYQFDYTNGGNDVSGNGYDLSQDGVVVPGWVGSARHLRFLYSTLSNAVWNNLIGAMSAYGLFRWNNASVQNHVLRWDNVSNGFAELRIQADESATNGIAYRHHDGTSDITYEIAHRIMPFDWFWCGFTRDSAGTGVKLFINGDMVGSNTMANPPGSHAGTGRLLVGHSASHNVSLQSLKILIGTELTETQMKNEYNLTHGIAQV